MPSHPRTRRRPVALAAVAAALALALCAAPPATANEWTESRVMNIAHQGGENEAPSNTMYAYERALRMGADMLEVDVHTSAEGELVVLHDATVDRTTDGSGRVYDLTLAEIQALDAGHDLVPGEGTEDGRPAADYPYRGVRTGERRPPAGYGPDDFRIPTLAEVMAAYPHVPINIEIKGAADSDLASFFRNAEALAAFLNRLGRTDGIIVASFNDAALARFHELAPQIDLAPATGAVAGYKLGGVMPPAGSAAFQVPISFSGITVVDEPFVDRAHADGYGVHVWTINDEETMQRLIGWDVDGIMTAEPIRLERVLCSGGVPRPPRDESLPGRHCDPRASIACEVEAQYLARNGKSLEIGLRRVDEFAGRCAGKVLIRPAGAPGRVVARFAFDGPPPEGVWRVTPRIKVRGRIGPRLRRGTQARISVHPYSGFLARTRLTVGD